MATVAASAAAGILWGARHPEAPFTALGTAIADFSRATIEKFKKKKEGTKNEEKGSDET